MKIRYKFNGDDCFESYDIENNEQKIGSLFIYTDYDGRKWLNGIKVKEEYRRNGIATKLVKKAIDVFGELYVSTASKTEHDDNNDNTARHLSIEGAHLVRNLEKLKIIKPEWMIHPFDGIDDH